MKSLGIFILLILALSIICSNAPKKTKKSKSAKKKAKLKPKKKIDSSLVCDDGKGIFVSRLKSKYDDCGKKFPEFCIDKLPKKKSDKKKLKKKLKLLKKAVTSKKRKLTPSQKAENKQIKKKIIKSIQKKILANRIVQKGAPLSRRQKKNLVKKFISKIKKGKNSKTSKTVRKIKKIINNKKKITKKEGKYCVKARLYNISYCCLFKNKHDAIKFDKKQPKFGKRPVKKKKKPAKTKKGAKKKASKRK